MDLSEITPEWILERIVPGRVIQLTLGGQVEGVWVSRTVDLTPAEILGVLRARKKEG